jgi:membrane-associated phospholipid phosphatase
LPKVSDDLTPMSRPVTSPIPGLAMFVRAAPAIAFALMFVALNGAPAPGETWVVQCIQRVPDGWVLAKLAIALALPIVQATVLVAAACISLRARNWTLFIAAFLVALALLVNPVLKEIFLRARPTVGDVVVRRPATGYSFPSGHTASATLIYGYSAGVLFGCRFKLAAVWSACAASAVALIAFERLYNGAHWPTDVIAGFVSGSMLLVVVFALADRGVSSLREWLRSIQSGAAHRLVGRVPSRGHVLVFDERHPSAPAER